MILKKLFASIIIASVFASCSMVKSPQSANFNRVKYNAHLKLAKKDTKEKLPETVKSFEEETKLISSESSRLAQMQLKTFKTPLLASTNSLDPKTADPIKVKAEQVTVEPSKKEKPLMGLFGQATELMHPKTINEYLNKPLPIATVADDSDLGNLLYLILVIILVLIIIGIIADLAGGAVGALIAVLLILLILRLLGII